MGYVNNDTCLEKAYLDEKIFVLLTRDATAPATIMEWIKMNIHTQPEEKLREAFDAAMEMKRRQAEISKRKEDMRRRMAHRYDK